MNTEISTTVTTAITEYNPIAAALATVEKYRGLVCDVTTPKGMAEAKAAQREVGALRIALEKTRKKVKEDVVARGKLIDGEANRIFALIAAIEVPIMTQIDAEEDRVERERQAAIVAEQERLAAMLEWTEQPALLPRCPLGDWRGHPWSEVEEGFLQWILRKITDREDVRFCAEKELVRRQEERAAARRRDAAEDTVPG